jgi:5'-3' exoribonuclease 1
MGFPGFFAYLLNKLKPNIKKIIYTHHSLDQCYLFIDANSVFHDVCNEVRASYINQNTVDMEKNMCKSIIIKLNKIISEVNPAKTYICVDGVPPMGKIIQQRKRRYMGAKKLVENNTDFANDWYNIKITPHTAFMNMIDKYLKKKYSSRDDVVVSDSSVRGEGEFKMFDQIINDDITNVVIYGLDTDLILLSMIQNKNIYLMREYDDRFKEHIHIDNEYVYISIDQLKKYFVQFMINNTDQNINCMQKSVYKQRLINDVVLLCMLFGNDFVMCLPSLSIYSHNLDQIINIYMTGLHEYDYLITDNDTRVDIHNDFFKYIINALSNDEENMLDNRLNKFNNTNSITNITDLNKYITSEQVNIDIKNIKLSKFRYYDIYFNSTEYQKNAIDNACVKYLNSVYWTINYYFHKNVSNNYYYPFNAPPFVSDIQTYMNAYKYNINNSELFDTHQHISDIEHLLIVIPPQCKCLLPDEYKHMLNSDSQISYMCPCDFMIDISYKKVEHQYIPILPPIDINYIKRVLQI